jgi:predicted phosphodiesterase
VKYGVISDVHANLEALDAVFAYLDRARVESVICLGDIVGYHADPNDCVARVRARCDVVLAGNHDRAVVGTLDPGDFPYLARRAIAWTRRVLLRDHVEYLATLPIFREIDRSTWLVHGSLAPVPNDRFHVSSAARVTANLRVLAASPARMCWFGHTHKPAVHTWQAAAAITPDVSQTGELTLPEDAHVMINPGSVGQPRDGDWRAACAVYDTDARRVVFHRVEYDRDTCMRHAQSAGLLGESGVLRRGLELARAGISMLRSW